MASNTRGRSSRHEGHQPPLVGHVERIEAQQLAGRGHRLGHRDGRLVDLDAHPGVQGDFVQCGGQPAAGQIAEAVDVGPRGQHGLHQTGQRRTVAFQNAVELKPLADGHDCHAVAAQVAAQQDRVAGP